MTLSYPIKDIQTIEAIKEQYRRKAQYRELLLFTLAINTGLKLVDLLSLKIKDVKNRDYIILEKDCLKNLKSYPINAETQDLIQNVSCERDDEELLFGTRSGAQLDRSYIHKNFQQICKELGLGNRYSILSWRKTFGYHYFQKTGDISMLMWIFNSQTIEKMLDFIDTETNFNFRFEKGFGL